MKLPFYPRLGPIAAVAFLVMNATGCAHGTSPSAQSNARTFSQKQASSMNHAAMPPLYATHHQEWEIKFATVTDTVMSVMPGESAKTFYDRLLRRQVKWEQDVYSPACAVLNHRLCCVYRAYGEDGQWRLGIAWSNDGVHFTRSGRPVFYATPQDKFLGNLRYLKGASVSYGDSRLFADAHGTFYLFFNYFSNGHVPNQELAIATTKDMVHWIMDGRAFAKQAARDVNVIPGEKVPRFWPAIVTRVEGGRLVAAKIHGRYWMYLSAVCHQFGEGFVATSENLLDWKILLNSRGRPVPMLALRKGYFDSLYIDPVAAVLEKRGIVLIYNGINAPADEGGDPRRMPLAHYPAQALFDRSNPAHLLERSQTPFEGGDQKLEKQPLVFWPAPLYEAFALVAFKNEFWLYWNNNCGRRRVALWKGPIPRSAKPD